MISEIRIANFKSISSLSLDLGRVTVLIGENGSGKSNILEAIAFASAAAADKLDDEFLYNRGIRVTDADFMTSRFTATQQPIELSLRGTAEDSGLDLAIRRLGRLPWLVSSPEIFSEFISEYPTPESEGKVALTDADRRQFEFHFTAGKWAASSGLADYLIYAPENTVLRNFTSEGAIKPLGAKGEGLLSLLTDGADQENPDFSEQLNSHLELLGWFSRIELPTEADKFRGRLRIQDRWITQNGKPFDQRSANEGFLYLLFYFTLFLSKRTPNVGSCLCGMKAGRPRLQDV